LEALAALDMTYNRILALSWRYVNPTIYTTIPLAGMESVSLPNRFLFTFSHCFSSRYSEQLIDFILTGHDRLASSVHTPSLRI
jgi:hypothetical protein